MKEKSEIELTRLIQSGEYMALVMPHISDFSEHLDGLVKITLDDSDQRNWRAAWILDKIHEIHPKRVTPFLPLMTEFVLTTRNAGKKRHLLKLISLHAIPEDKLIVLLNFCIDVFTSATEPVAVRVHAMQILFNIAQQEPGFVGELIDLIENEIELHGSAGISSRGKKLLTKLYALKE